MSLRIHYLFHTSSLYETSSPFTKDELDEVQGFNDCIRFKKNNLYGYYGIHMKGRYKKLDQFQGFYARFQLPNGKQGWIDRNGKEYLNL